MPRGDVASAQVRGRRRTHEERRHGCVHVWQGARRPPNAPLSTLERRGCGRCLCRERVAFMKVYLAGGVGTVFSADGGRGPHDVSEI